MPARGLTSFTERYTDSFNRWFDDLGELHLDPEVAAKLVAGLAEATGEQTTAELSARRDALRCDPAGDRRQALALQRRHAGTLDGRLKTSSSIGRKSWRSITG